MFSKFFVGKRSARELDTPAVICVDVGSVEHMRIPNVKGFRDIDQEPEAR